MKMYFIFLKLQDWSVTIRYSLMSYPVHLRGGLTPSAEMLLAHSTVPANWAGCTLNYFRKPVRLRNRFVGCVCVGGPWVGLYA